MEIKKLNCAESDEEVKCAGTLEKEGGLFENKETREFEAVVPGDTNKPEDIDVTLKGSERDFIRKEIFDMTTVGVKEGERVKV